MDEDLKMMGCAGLAGLMLVGLFWASCFVPVNRTYSTGERTGIVTKIAEKGFLFKTWEGEMNTGGFAPQGKEGTFAPVVWEFTVPDPALAQRIAQDARQGHRLTLHYRQVWKNALQDGLTSYRVVKVEVEGEPAGTEPTSTTN